MTARWDWRPCDCSWNDYRADCPKPYHVALALRELPNPRVPLILCAPCPDTVPAWMTEAAS